MRESDISDLRSQFVAEIDEAFSPRLIWSTHNQISYRTAESGDEDEEEDGNELSTPSFPPSQDSQQIFAGGLQGQEHRSISYGHQWSEVDTTRAKSSSRQKLSGNRRPSESGSQIPLFDLQSVASNTAATNARQTTHMTRSNPCTWLPLTLRWPFMIAVSISALHLGIVTIILTNYSVQNFGICDYNESMGFHSAWRFLPTIVAVLYTLAITTLVNDVKRTEAFAKLAKPHGSSALSSLFISSGYWWEDPVRALSREANDGRRSWTLLWISLTNIMAVLLVSPFSSGLLSLSEVQIPRRSDFLRLEIPSPLTPVNTTTDETYFRTISSLVQNLTTSAWLSESYAILPFWPADFDQVPFGASMMTAGQRLQGQTAVFQADIQCTSMESAVKYYSPQGLGNYEIITLTSLDGCKIELNVGAGFYPPSAGCWSKAGTLDLPVPYGGEESPIQDQSKTPECGDREVIFIMSPFPTNQTNGSIAQLCAPKYFAAYNMTTVVSDTPAGTIVSIDDETFDRTKVLLDSSTLSIHSFETQFLDSNWATFYQSPVDNDNVNALPSLGGPLVLLAATINGTGSDIGPIFNPTELLRQARRIQQRFFGEALQAVFMSLPKNNSQNIVAQVTVTKMRLLVGHWIGIALGVIFLTSAALVFLTFYCSRLQRRPLNLNQDPGSTAGVISMVSEDALIGKYFRGFDKLPENCMKTILGSTIFAVVDNQLVVKDDGMTVARDKNAIDLQGRSCLKQALRSLGLSEATRLDDDWRPAILRRWTGSLLIGFLASTAAALIALLVVSKGPGLYQSAFVYQTSATLDNNTLVDFAPYSIVPTIFAVAVRLWWGALEENFKRLQPYVLMAREPTKASSGITLSYINLPQVFALGKALKKGHWLLALVCLGAFWTEIFTISMSAIWQKSLRNSQKVQLLSAQLEPRDIPQVFQVPVGSTREHTVVLSHIFTNPSSSWLNGAVIQIAYNGSKPAWSLDGWSFAQVSLPSVSEEVNHPSQDSNVSHKIGPFNVSSSKESFGRQVNVTIQTPAVRARIECSPYETLTNLSNWLQEWDLRNESLWNVTANPKEPARGYELLPVMSLSPDTSTTLFADNARIQCCANGTTKEPGLSSIGYWSRNSKTGITDDVLNPDIVLYNFTVKWIVGRPLGQSFADTSNQSHFIWEGPPSIAALNCQPIIETADTSVTIDMGSGAVQNFSVNDHPSVATSAWSDYYKIHNSTDPSSDLIYEGQTNVTVSYGALFMDILYNAARWASIGSDSAGPSDFINEDLNDKTFNFRLTGLNLDYMSYAMFSLVQQSPQALLNSTTLQSVASQVFSTFFQHYALSNVSLTDGGRVFQPIGASLPFGLPPIVNFSTKQPSSYQDPHASTTSVNRTIEAILHTPVDELVMSPTAVFLCLAILAFLAGIAALVYFPYAAHFKGLPRDMETLASIIALVYDSPKVQQWVAANAEIYTAIGTKKGRAASGTVSGDVKTGLGFFRGENGGGRWGVEIEPVAHAHPRHPYTALVATREE